MIIILTIKHTCALLTKLRQEWLGFCKEHCISVIANKTVMMVFSIRALYNSLLEHVSFKQANLNVQLAALQFLLMKKIVFTIVLGEEPYVRYSIAIANKFVVRAIKTWFQLKLVYYKPSTLTINQMQLSICNIKTKASCICQTRLLYHLYKSQIQT